MANPGDAESYKSAITLYFYQRNFDQLEREARTARTSKERLPGGAWKLYDFYEAVDPLKGKDQADESAWTTYLATAKEWVAAKPESVTARIALAEAHLSAGWRARGSGYSDTVTDQGWETFRSQAELARTTLVEAAQLKEKCPYWYEAMQHVAMAQGWDKRKARELFDQAVAFEPAYYHYYREYANYLLPKWYGEDGEAEAFAEEVSSRVGSEEGAFLYFEIASLLTCPCAGDSDPTHLARMSWPKVKQGYAMVGQMYGLSNLKRNRFAYMAYVAKDRPAAQQAFAEIGDNWDHEVWRSSERFQQTKAWAMSGAEPASSASTSY